MMEILYMAPSLSRDFYLYAGGVRVTCNPHKGLLRKITSIEIGNQETVFVPVVFSKRIKNRYSVTADTCVPGFAGQIRKLARHPRKSTFLFRWNFGRSFRGRKKQDQ